MVNDYRNPIVAEAMKEMKYVNMFNQGVKRVQDMLRENGNKEAEFDVSKLTVFCVDVFSNKDNTTQTTTQILSDVQIAIIEYIHSHPNTSRKEIAANISGITENGVKYHMQKLQKQGIIKRVGADFGGHWEINLSYYEFRNESDHLTFDRRIGYTVNFLLTVIYFFFFKFHIFVLTKGCIMLYRKITKRIEAYLLTSSMRHPKLIGE